METRDKQKSYFEQTPYGLHSSGVKFTVDNKTSAQHALENFRTYFLIHALAFGSTLRSKILSAAPEIMKGSTVRWTDEVDHVLELSS